MTQVNFSKIKKGDFILIEGKRYEVIDAQREADIWIPGEELQTFLCVYLHEENSKSILPTHEIHYYSDQKISFNKTGDDYKQILKNKIHISN